MEREGAPGSYDRDQPEPQHPRSTAEDLTAAPVVEPTLSEAVGDLDAAPAAASPPAEPAGLQPAQASPPPAQPEPQRRRSTVREPAPISGSGEAPPPAPAQPAAPARQPVVNEIGESEGENTDQPRRRGWWSRRIAGG
jgi:ribonuclease E